MHRDRRRRAPGGFPRGVLLPFWTVLLLFAGCGGRSERFTPPSVQPGNYEAVVSLTPSVTEILFALGAGDRVAGVTSRCDYPPEAAGLAKVGDFLRPNIEAVLSLDPDLVILAPTGNLLRSSYADLVRLGVPVLVVWDNTVEEALAAVREIGRVLRLGKEAAALAARIRGEMESEKKRLAGAPPLRVLWIMGRNPLVAVGGGTFQAELLEAAGGRNVASGLGAWPVLSPEFVLDTDPDVIIDSSMDSSRPAGSLPHDLGGDRGNVREVFSGRNPWERFRTLTAVRTGRVFFLNEDPLYRPGPRMARALALLGRTLHPGLYPDVPKNAGAGR